MTTLVLPRRRHRRKLLLPPGLLALAWLLWLGCAALPQMRGMQKPQVILQLTMPPLKSCFGPDSWPMPGSSALLFSNAYPLCLPAEKLEEFRTWQTVTFTGNIFADYFSYQQALHAFEAVKKDTTYLYGIRTQFESRATYNSLVFSIDLINRQDIKRWWLDIRHQPTTLYAFTNKPGRTFTWGEGGFITEPEPAQSFDFSVLLLPDWRYSTLLLLLMACFSVGRLVRQRRAG